LLIFQFAIVYPVNSEVFPANDFHFGKVSSIKVTENKIVDRNLHCDEEKDETNKTNS